MLNDIFYEIVEDVNKVVVGFSGHDFLINISKKYYLSHVAYFGFNLPGHDADVFIQTNYSDKWARRYVTQNSVDLDPIVNEGFRGILPVDWRTLSRNNKKVKKFMDESWDVKLGRQGLSFPIRGAHGEMALFSIHSHLSDDGWSEFRRDYMRDFQLLAYHFHNNILENELKVDAPVPVLTLREKQCVKWASAGKTAWETGVILGIKESTVSFFIDQVRVKLNAVNKTEAVAKAIKLNLI